MFTDILFSRHHWFSGPTLIRKTPSIDLKAIPIIVGGPAMTNKMVLIITTTKFKVTVYLTFKEAFDHFNFCLDSNIFVLLSVVYKLLRNINYLHSLYSLNI